MVGYVRVSADEQADSDASLEAQRAAIENEVSRRGWELVDVMVDAAESGKGPAGRPGLARALELVESGRVDGLVVARLDRLARPSPDFASLIDRSRRKGWGLVAPDLEVDTSTPSGEAMAYSHRRWAVELSVEPTPPPRIDDRPAPPRVQPPVHTPSRAPRRQIVMSRDPGEWNVGGAAPTARAPGEQRGSRMPAVSGRRGGRARMTHLLLDGLRGASRRSAGSVLAVPGLGRLPGRLRNVHPPGSTFLVLPGGGAIGVAAGQPQPMPSCPECGALAGNGPHLSQRPTSGVHQAGPVALVHGGQRYRYYLAGTIAGVILAAVRLARR